MVKASKVVPDYSQKFKALIPPLKTTRQGLDGPNHLPGKIVVVGMPADPQVVVRRRAEKRPEDTAAPNTLPVTDIDAGQRRKRSRHDGSEVPFLTNATACAQFVRSVKGGTSSSFDLDELREVGDFEDASKKLCGVSFLFIFLPWF